jgi:hypothetical protein
MRCHANVPQPAGAALAGCNDGGVGPGTASAGIRPRVSQGLAQLTSSAWCREPG